VVGIPAWFVVNTVVTYSLAVQSEASVVVVNDGKALQLGAGVSTTTKVALMYLPSVSTVPINVVKESKLQSVASSVVV
jgi:hypothetical protein